MSTQTVLCVKRGVLEEKLGRKVPLGFSIDKKLFAEIAKIYEQEGQFLERPTVENDQSILQAIVYGIVARQGKVMALWRSERQSKDGNFKETRHNNKIGLACGGHVEPLDESGGNFFDKAFLRELSEELLFPNGFSEPTPVGIIMYEETLFDSVHLGLIYAINADAVALPKQSDEYSKVEFLDINELPVLRDRMEGWGKVIGDALISSSLLLS